MTTSKEKSRRPKFDIPTISGGASKETEQVERVMNFLVTGTAAGGGLAQSGGDPAGAVPPSALAVAGEVPPAERGVSLDHVFHSAARRPARTRDDGDEDTGDVSVKSDAVVAGPVTAEPSRVEHGEGERQTTSAAATTHSETQPGAGEEQWNQALVSTSNAAATVAPAVPFEEFISRFGKLLRPSQIQICRVVYENSIAVGKAEYETTMPDLALQIGLVKRSCFLLVNRMEELGFITRTPLQGGKRMLGIALRLNIDAFK